MPERPMRPTLPARPTRRSTWPAQRPTRPTATPEPVDPTGGPDAPGAAASGPDAPGAAPPARGLTGRFPAIGSPVYRRLLAGNLLATLGAFMQATSQGWLVLQLTNSPGLLGLVGAIAGAPTLFLAVVAGVLADRLDRRRLLVWSYAAAAALATLLAFLTSAGLVAYWQVAVIAFLGGIRLTVQMPASQAIVSTVVDRAALGSAIALNSAQYNLMRIVGPSLAGFAIVAGGLALGFWVNALMLAVVAIIFARLPLVQTRAAGRLQAALWGDLQDGVRHVAADRVLTTLVVLAAAPALFVLSYLTFLPVFARDILRIGAPGLGLLTGSIGIGALAGALLMATRRPSGGSGRLLLLGLAAMSVSLATFALSTFVPLTIVALAILGASQVAYYSTTNTLLQTRVPARLRGRVHSLYVLTSIGLLPVGNLVVGAIAERTGVPIVLAAGGALTLLAVLIAAVARPELAGLTPDRAGVTAGTAVSTGSGADGPSGSTRAP
ncbi:MAG: MFS transporter [Chloroflexi bacterium]|nr:MFS transporter [Chloroflexota bacterium]